MITNIIEYQTTRRVHGSAPVFCLLTACRTSQFSSRYCPVVNSSSATLVDGVQDLFARLTCRRSRCPSQAAVRQLHDLGFEKSVQSSSKSSGPSSSPKRLRSSRLYSIATFSSRRRRTSSRTWLIEATLRYLIGNFRVATRNLWLADSTHQKTLQFWTSLHRTPRSTWSISS